jgi:hypothetical protein
VWGEKGKALEEGGIKMKKVDEVEINKWEIVGK